MLHYPGDLTAIDHRRVQMAIELEGVSIGDVAVGIHDKGRQATIGVGERACRQSQGVGRPSVKSPGSCGSDMSHSHSLSICGSRSSTAPELSTTKSAPSNRSLRLA